MEHKTGPRGAPELPYLAVSSHCFEDPDDPGLCAYHEVHHLANGNDLDMCRGEVPRRL